MLKRFLIDYENAHWCGGQLNVVVWAHDADEAVERAWCHMEEEQRELFSSEYDEEDGVLEDESAFTVNSVEEFTPDHEDWKYFQCPTQESFYPVIGAENDC